MAPVENILLARNIQPGCLHARIRSQQHTPPSVEEYTYCSHGPCYKLHEDRETGITNSFHTVTELEGNKGRKEGRGVEVKGKEKTHVLRTFILSYFNSLSTMQIANRETPIKVVWCTQGSHPQTVRHARNQIYPNF